MLRLLGLENIKMDKSIYCKCRKIGHALVSIITNVDYRCLGFGMTWIGDLPIEYCHY